MAAARSFQAFFGSIGSAVRSSTNLIRRKGPDCLNRLKHTASAQVGATAQHFPRWQLCAAVCMTRLPLVSPNPLDIEKKYIQLLQKQEYENSVLSNWELEKIKQSEIIRAVEMGEKDPLEMDFKVSAQDIEDENQAKEKEFLDAHVAENSAVDDNDTQNVNRKMRDSLVYVVKKKLGNDEVWILPSVPIIEGETMRQCAERSLSLHTTSDFQGRILTNAPSAFFKYKFPKGVRLKNDGGYSGAKVFIFSAVANVTGHSTVSNTSAKSDYPSDCDILTHAWVTKEELKKHLKPKYFEAVKRILP